MKCQCRILTAERQVYVPLAGRTAAKETGQVAQGGGNKAPGSSAGRVHGTDAAAHANVVQQSQRHRQRTSGSEQAVRVDHSD